MIKNTNKKFTKNQRLKLLAIILLSDGYVHKTKGKVNSIRLTTVDYNKCQHKLFCELCLSLFKKKPKIYSSLNRRNVTSELFSRNIEKTIYSLSPTYQTSPSKNLPQEEYLKVNQPTIRFLDNEPLNFKFLALLMYFDFDGSISPALKLKKKRDYKNGKLYIYYQVQLEIEIRIAETNPNLNTELIKICGNLGIKANRALNKRNWSGIEGLRISKINDIKKFISNDVITTVKISAKSNRFKGITKSSIFKSIHQILKYFPLSRSFKKKKEAEEYRKDLNKRILKICRNSPVL